MKESGGNGRGSDLKQIENVFKDPEDGFWKKNNSEGILGNSEVYSKYPSDRQFNL